MEYERIPLDKIHPIIKGWIGKYLGTVEYFIIDSIHRIGTNEFEYLILPLKAIYPYRLILTINENGQYSFKTTPRPFRRLSLTND